MNFEDLLRILSAKGLVVLKTGNLVTYQKPAVLLELVAPQVFKFLFISTFNDAHKILIVDNKTWNLPPPSFSDVEIYFRSMLPLFVSTVPPRCDAETFSINFVGYFLVHEY